MQIIFLTQGKRKKPYFIINRTHISIPVAHKRFPELVGHKTAQALEMLKTNPIVMVKVRND